MKTKKKSRRLFNVFILIINPCKDQLFNIQYKEYLFI